MSDELSLEAILGDTKDREKQYDWLGATKFFKKALGLVPDDDYSKKGEVCERLGYVLYRASMKAESVTEFKASCTKAVESYEEAKRFYERLNELGGTPHFRARMLRTKAAIALMGYWLAAEVSEKRRMLDGCWRLAKECLETFEKTGDALEYGTTCNRFVLAPYCRFFLE
jgi:tetratricopeptide (TPR) repeat protein